jgi:hypothetical protein
MFNACAGPGAHCVVGGAVPGAIDSIEPIYHQTGEDGGLRHVVAHAYAFRCVIDSTPKSDQ